MPPSPLRQRPSPQGLLAPWCYRCSSSQGHMLVSPQTSAASPWQDISLQQRLHECEEQLKHAQVELSRRGQQLDALQAGDPLASSSAERGSDAAGLREQLRRRSERVQQLEAELAAVRARSRSSSRGPQFESGCSPRGGFCSSHHHKVDGSEQVTAASASRRRLSFVALRSARGSTPSVPSDEEAVLKLPTPRVVGVARGARAVLAEANTAAATSAAPDSSGDPPGTGTRPGQAAAAASDGPRRELEPDPPCGDDEASPSPSLHMLPAIAEPAAFPAGLRPDLRTGCREARAAGDHQGQRELRRAWEAATSLPQQCRTSSGDTDEAPAIPSQRCRGTWSSADEAAGSPVPLASEKVSSPTSLACTPPLWLWIREVLVPLVAAHNEVCAPRPHDATQIACGAGMAAETSAAATMVMQGFKTAAGSLPAYARPPVRCHTPALAPAACGARSAAAMRPPAATATAASSTSTVVDRTGRIDPPGAKRGPATSAAAVHVRW